MVKTGRVELDEFHIRYAGTGTPCHGNPVPGRGIGVGGIKVNLACTTRCQHSMPGGKRMDDAFFFIQDIKAVAFERLLVFIKLVRRDQVDGEMIFI